jgi:hypothetical protein
MRINTEIKIFFTFFVVFTLFVHWIGPNENSRLNLVKAIIDEKRLTIDSFYNNTEDRVYFNNHYYSDKEPGASFFALPIYGSLKFIYNLYPQSLESVNNTSFYTHSINNATFYEPVKLDSLALNSMLLITIFTSSLFSAFTVVLIYKISKYFMKNKRERILVTVLIGLGSTIFPYALLFFDNALSTFFVFASFYILFYLKHEKVEKKKYFLISGLFAGFAFLFSILNAIPILLLLFYLFSFNRKNTPLFLIGLIIGVSPFLFYNLSIYGNPFAFARENLDRTVFQYGNTTTLPHPHLSVALHLLFYPERGIFVYYPFLLFSFIGMFYFFKKFKAETVLILVSFVSNLLVMSSYGTSWWGGASFGPRYFSSLIPLLFLPLFYLFGIKKEKVWKFAILALLFYSIFINFTSMNQIITLTPDSHGHYTIPTSRTSFEVYDNPIVDHYIPLFLKVGSRSRILESLFTSTNIDIRGDYYQLQPTSGIQFSTTPFGFLTLRIQTLSIVIILLIILFTWRKEILNVIPKKYSYFAYLLPILMLLLALDFQKVNFGDNWYTIYKNETYTDPYRWMSNNGTIYLFAQKAGNYFINASWGSLKNITNLDVYLNGKFAFTTNVTYFGKNIHLNSGENTIILKSKEGCMLPSEWNDTRCLSIGFTDFQSISENDLIRQNAVFYGDNWYTIYKNETYIDPYRWMSNNGTIYLFAQQDDVVYLNATIVPFNKTRELLLYFNGNFIKNYNITFNTLGIKLNVKQGQNTLELYAPNGCDYNLNTTCLSFGVSNLTTFTVEDLQKNQEIFYGENWYEIYQNSTFTDQYRWMSNNGTIYFFSSEKTNAILNFSFVGYKNQTFDIILNNKTIDTYSNNITNVIYPELIELNLGENVLVLRSHEGCQIPTEWNTSNCLSIAVSNITVRTENNLKNSEAIWGKNWYYEENISGIKFRWMSSNASVFLINPSTESKNFILNFTFWSYYKNRNAKIDLENTSKVITANPIATSISLKVTLKPGINVMNLASKSGCDVPALIESKHDKRCLSIAIAEPIMKEIS